MQRDRNPREGVFVDKHQGFDDREHAASKTAAGEFLGVDNRGWLRMDEPTEKKKKLDFSSRRARSTAFW